MSTKAENFRNAPKLNFDLYVISFICTNFEAFTTFSAIFTCIRCILFIVQLYSYCPEAPYGRVKYVAHRASCFANYRFSVFLKYGSACSTKYGFVFSRITVFRILQITVFLILDIRFFLLCKIQFSHYSRYS